MKRLLRSAIKIIAAEREIAFSSYSDASGKIHGVDEAAEVRKFDRWLKAARLVLEQPDGASLLAWVYHRTRNGLFSRKRAVRDQALADVNRAAQAYASVWTPRNASDPNQIWTGERP